MSNSDELGVFMMPTEFWEELRAGPLMSDSEAGALYVQIGALLAGDLAWVRQIKKTRFLTCMELLALILHKIRETEKPTRDEKKVIAHWAREIKKAVEKELIVGLDHDSHTSISLVDEEGWNWETSLGYVDVFFEQIKSPWRCSELLNSFENEENQKPVKRAWNGAALKSLLAESLMPGVTHKELAKKYGVSPQRISALLKDANGKFSKFGTKSSLPITHAMDKIGRKKR